MVNKPSLHISILQMDLAWEAPAENLRKAEKLLEQAQPTTDLIVLPEMFSTGFSMKPQRIAENMHGPTMVWMRKLAARYDALVAGSMIIEEHGHFYNRFLAMDSYGIVHQYDKIKLFSMTGEDVAYRPGDALSPFEWRHWRILPQICYDLRFPEQVRLRDSSGQYAYDVLLYVANWPSVRAAHWDTLLRARAIENQCYVVAANRLGEDKNGLHYNGHSAILGPQGEQLAFSTEEAVLEALLEAEPMEAWRSKFPAWRDC
jgi:predicted amidohydrolase